MHNCNSDTVLQQEFFDARQGNFGKYNNILLILSHRNSKQTSIKKKKKKLSSSVQLQHYEGSDTFY